MKINQFRFMLPPLAFVAVFATVALDKVSAEDSALITNVVFSQMNTGGTSSVGVSGQDGQPGQSGKNGQTGQDGQAGVSGTAGSNGQPGQDGQPGRDGSSVTTANGNSQAVLKITTDLGGEPTVTILKADDQPELSVAASTTVDATLSSNDASATIEIETDTESNVVSGQISIWHQAWNFLQLKITKYVNLLF